MRLGESGFLGTPRRRLPVVLQTETSDCGLACLAMVSAWHGFDTDLPALKRRFAISAKGATLKGLIDIAGRLSLLARPLRLELGELSSLRTPCILHWDLNHFVVLEWTSADAVQVIDPAQGRSRMRLTEAGRHFTGVALELDPAPSFEPRRERTTLSIRTLLGGLRGLRARFVETALLALAMEIFVLASPLYIQWVVDGAIVSGDADLLLLLAVGFLLVVITQATIGVARSLVIVHASTRLSLYWNGGLFSHLLHLPVAWFERRHVADVVSRFGSINGLQRALTASFVESLVDGVMATATLALMLFLSPALTAVAVLSAALYALSRCISFMPLRRANEEQIVHSARAHSSFTESLRAVASIKLFNREELRYAQWMNATVDATNRNATVERIGIFQRGVQSLLGGVEHVALVYLGALLVMQGALSVGMLLAFVAYRTTFAGRVTALADKWVQLRMLGLHKDRIADIAVTKREMLDGLAAGSAGPDATLEAVNLSFRYGEGEPWVLRNVNLRIRPGECVAITGTTGCGKTTLLKILMGLIPPVEGQVRLGDVPIDRLGLGEYRRRIAGVMQDDQLLAGSIADNIAFFDAQSDRTRIEACARIAAVHEEILSMPMGYETLVGDMGSSLSGGQKQRILLARALYKRPEVLFLDEATSHLDVLKEGLINESVRTLRFTRVLVAHRPHTIASAERVIVLEDGRIKGDSRVSATFSESFPRPAH